MELLRLFLPRRATTGGMARIAYVRVAIVDVGANTLRLLVATRQEGRLVALREQRVQLGLGEDIEYSGGIGEEKLAEAAAKGVRFDYHPDTQPCRASAPLP